MTQNCTCHGSGGQNSQTVAATLERPRYSLFSLTGTAFDWSLVARRAS